MQPESYADLTSYLFLQLVAFITRRPFWVPGEQKALFLNVLPRTGWEVRRAKSFVSALRDKGLLIDCPETRSKVVTLPNHKGHTQSPEPIKTCRKRAKRKKTCASEWWLFWALLLIGWKSGSRIFLSNPAAWLSKAKPKDTHVLGVVLAP